MWIRRAADRLAISVRSLSGVTSTAHVPLRGDERGEQVTQSSGNIGRLAKLHSIVYMNTLLQTWNRGGGGAAAIGPAQPGRADGGGG